MEDRMVRGRMVAVQRREGVEAVLAKLGAVAVGSIETVRAQRRAECRVQRRRARTSPQLLAVVVRQRRGTGRQRSVEPSEYLDRSKLSRLQSGGRFEWIAELEKSLRSQGLEHAQLHNQQLVDARGAVQRRHRILWAAGLQLRNRAVELVEDDLE